MKQGTEVKNNILLLVIIKIIGLAKKKEAFKIMNSYNLFNKYPSTGFTPSFLLSISGKGLWNEHSFFLNTN